MKWSKWDNLKSLYFCIKQEFIFQGKDFCKENFCFSCQWNNYNSHCILSLSINWFFKLHAIRHLTIEMLKLPRQDWLHYEKLLRSYIYRTAAFFAILKISGNCRFINGILLTDTSCCWSTRAKFCIHRIEFQKQQKYFQAEKHLFDILMHFH